MSEHSWSDINLCERHETFKDELDEADKAGLRPLGPDETIPQAAFAMREHGPDGFLGCRGVSARAYDYPVYVKAHLELWLCGQSFCGPKPWEFQGIFSTEDKAVAACRSDMYFIYPVTLDKEWPNESCTPDGARYPKDPIDENSDKERDRRAEGGAE